MTAKCPRSANMADHNVWQLVIIHAFGPALGSYPIPHGEGADGPIRRFDLATQNPDAIAVYLFKDGELVAKHQNAYHKIGG